MTVGDIRLDHCISIGIGGTHFRRAIYDRGELNGFLPRPTPTEPTAFFTEVGRELLKAADQGAAYGVVGVPGAVFEETDEHGNRKQRLACMPNVAGLSKGAYYPLDEMSRIDPAVGRQIEDGFRVLFTNDGNLAVQAAIATLAKGDEEVVADIIVGTGMGGALARRDRRFPRRIFHAIPGSWELGHNIRRYHDPLDTEENDIAGPAIERRYGVKAEELPKGDPALHYIAGRLALISANLGMNADAELVVFSGGVAIGRQEELESPVRSLLDRYRSSDNPSAARIPQDILFVPQEMEKEFELYGAQGVMRSHLIQMVSDTLIREAMTLDGDATSTLRDDLRQLAA